MLWIGWRNLRREPLRMTVAVCGVIFAVALVTVQTGMLLGLARNASLLIDRSRAEIWVSAPEVKTFDFATPFPANKRFLIEALAGVAKVEEFNVSVTTWKLPDGGNANCQIVAFDLLGDLAPSLTVAEGRVADLHNQDAVIVDSGSRQKLGNPRVGDQVEVLRSKARVAGFTQGMQSFTTMPFVFTSLRRGEKYGWMGLSNELSGGGLTVIYLLVKVAPGFESEAVRATIQERVPGIEAHTREDFSWRTRRYWMIETGVGLAFLVAALLCLAVGGVVLSQTLYALTLEKLPEFGVLKALGAGMGELARVVLEQSLVCAVGGILGGLGISYLVSRAAANSGTTVEIPGALALAVSLLALALCSGASLVSILRLRRVAPALVFRT